MPYFLTAAYKEIVDGVHKEREEERKRVEEAQEAGGKKSKNKDAEGAQTSSGGMYRSMFLKTKVEQQNEKKRKDRKNPNLKSGTEPT